MADIDRFLAVLARTESGNDPTARNKDSGAFGYYQILPSNWPAWAKEAGVDPSDTSAAAQNKVARFKVQQLYDALGSWDAVAVAWYAGPSAAKAYLKNPTAPRFTKKQTSGGTAYPSIAEYVQRINTTLDNAPSNAQAPVDPLSLGAVAPVLAQQAQQPADKLPPNATDAQIVTYINKNYPDVAALLPNPELRKIMFDAARRGDDDTEVLQALKQTDYWQTHALPSRNFDALISTDPAEAARQVADKKQYIAGVVGKQGIKLDDQQLGELAKKAIRGAWDDTDLNRWAADRLSGNMQLPGGAAKINAGSIKTTAQSYGVKLSDQAANEWAVDILAGSQTQDTFMSYVLDQSKKRFAYDPSILRGLDQGIAPATFLDPQKQALADAFEIDPSQVDLWDPKYSPVVQMHDDAAKTQRAMTPAEATQWARDQIKNMPYAQRPNWWKQQDASIGLGLSNFLGLVSGGN